MSELINKTDPTKGFRWHLLATTSAIVLCAAVAAAKAEDSDRPTVWIELGGQLSHLDDSQPLLQPVFPNSPPRPSMFSSSDGYQGMPPNSIDETGKITFHPKETDWLFSAAVRYGRSNTKRHVHQQTYPQQFFTSYYLSGNRYTRKGDPSAAKFADTAVQHQESHLLLDFQAGKDVGLGLFGRHGVSVLNVGVRFAQFSTRTNIAIKSDPDWRFGYVSYDFPTFGIYNLRFIRSQPYHSNAATLVATRSFHGVGPSLSWNGSAPLLGNGKDTELTFDMGVNAAVLFGRQKAKVHHQSTGRYHPTGKYVPGGYRPITHQAPATPDHTRSRSVVVPNIGAFVGATYRIANFKLSAGYRADFFFGAMDNGVDTRKTQTVGFHGPFANISIGLGG